MSEELDNLKQAFKLEPEIKASESAKKRAMQSAMHAFEKQHENTVKAELKDSKTEQTKKSANNSQGNIDHTRHKGENRNKAGLFNLFDWSNLMKFSYIIPVFLVIVIGIAAVGPATLNNESGNGSNSKIQSMAEFSNQHNPTIVGAQDGFRNEAVETLSIKPQKSITLAKPVPYQGGISSAGEMPIHPPEKVGHDKFDTIETSPIKLTKEAPVSTFSIDVDTASYSFMRGSINRGRLPQKNAIRVEELINYFPYDYAQPNNVDQPFNVSTTVIPTPWNENTKLLHIGIKGYELATQENPKSNLVFLLDTSGSMNHPNKLPLLINSFKLLLSTLQDDDIVSIVAYAGSAGTVLEPTKAKEQVKIIQALERLRAGGSTAGGQGIQLAYQLAEANYDKDAVNRVILATDGDFNVGIHNPEELKSFIERKRETGVYLSVLGFGRGNYNDQLMQQLAQNGNGNAAYIDSLSEARKVLVEEASSTLFTIAKDVKIQMEFNPNAVSEYRLIGYETRQLKREDFNNDKVDAGDIGAGHTVTAIYEITPSDSNYKSVDPLRYGQDSTAQNNAEVDSKQTEYGFLKLRYKLPDENKSTLIETSIQIADQLSDIESASIETKFASAVAAFGQLLRGGKYTHSYSYDDVLELALDGRGNDEYGYRAEFISLVRLTKSLSVTNLRSSN